MKDVTRKVKGKERKLWKKQRQRESNIILSAKARKRLYMRCQERESNEISFTMLK